MFNLRKLARTLLGAATNCEGRLLHLSTPKVGININWYIIYEYNMILLIARFAGTQQTMLMLNNLN